jgi:son of sevenless-like protein
MTNWVAEMILAQTDVRKRVVVIKHFVAVADVSGVRYVHSVSKMLT